MSEWESVSAPHSAAFIGWGQQEGQHVTGRVAHVGTGSKPNNAGSCPELTVELTESTFSLRKGERVDLEAGTTVTVTAAQYQLERDISAAQLSPGDLVKITLKGVFQTRTGNTVKDFDVQVKRNATPPIPQQPVQQGFSAPVVTGLSVQAPF